MKKELVKIDHKEFGLEDKTAQQVSKAFIPMLEKMEGLEDKYNNIVNSDISEETCKTAKELRLEYVKIRTGVAKIHKEEKQRYLLGGRFVDGWKNAQLMASQGKEEKLKAIEDHFENIEKERLQQIHTEREIELIKYSVEVIPPNLGKMEESIWINFLAGTKANYEMQKQAEEKAEADRIAKEKADKEEQERIKKENAELKAKAEEQARLQAIKDKEIAQAEAKKQAEHDAQMKAEREEKAKLEAELKAKAEAEKLAFGEEEKRKEAELSKGDSEKVQDLINDLEAIKTKYTFDSKKNQEMYQRIKVQIDLSIKSIGV